MVLGLVLRPSRCAWDRYLYFVYRELNPRKCSMSHCIGITSMEIPSIQRYKPYMKRSKEREWPSAKPTPECTEKRSLFFICGEPARRIYAFAIYEGPWRTISRQLYVSKHACVPGRIFIRPFLLYLDKQWQEYTAFFVIFYNLFPWFHSSPFLNLMLL